MVNWLGEALFKRSAWDKYREITASAPLFVVNPRHVKYKTRVIGKGSPSGRWSAGVLAVFADPALGVQLYPMTPPIEPAFTCTKDALRWFGRPQKYARGQYNEIILHAQTPQGEWHVVTIQLFYDDMMAFVRAIKQIASEAQIKAYRRHRPYVHYGPLAVQRGEQDIHGAWTLEAERLTLYLTPSHLVVLAGDHVREALPVNELTRIEARRRLDADDGTGLARFVIGETSHAFATPDFEALASAIAEASKRSLEEPLIRKQKKKDDGEDEGGSGDAMDDWDEDDE